MTKNKPDFSRQSFLGPRSQQIFETAKVGIVGVGGGGSPIGRELAHVGFLNYALYDSQRIDASNLNRLIGGSQEAVDNEELKVEIVRSLILRVRPGAKVEAIPKRWQDDPAPLRTCDLIFGCLDTFAERRELEILSRRYLIPYIDIGMDVHQIEGEPPRMAGQVALSIPGGPCLWCFGIISEENLAKEAANYGNAGPRPQVVWPNGVLASTAVGIAVDLLTDWTRSLRGPVYYSYDGNLGTLTRHVRLKYLESCTHYSLGDVGDPVFRALQ